jgi:hypothetical protein
MTDQKPDPAEMESALKVISTWASVPGALDAKHVRNLCDKALRRRPLDQVHQMLQDEARASVSYVESDAVTYGFEEQKP